MPTKPTPGPWGVHLAFQQEIVAEGGRGEVALASVLQPYKERHEERLANARLIAAAPDLLAALKAIVEGYEASRAKLSKAAKMAQEPRYIEQARTAIAKAEGK